MQEGDDDKVDRASDDVAMDDGISDMEVSKYNSSGLTFPPKYLRSKMKGKTSDKSEEESSDSGSNSSSSSSEGGSKSSSSDENDSSDSSSDSDSDDDSGDESSSKRTSKRRRVEESQAEETPKVFSVRMRGLPFSATEVKSAEYCRHSCFKGQCIRIFSPTEASGHPNAIGPTKASLWAGIR